MKEKLQQLIQMADDMKALASECLEGGDEDHEEENVEDEDDEAEEAPEPAPAAVSDAAPKPRNAALAALLKKKLGAPSA